MGAVILRPAYTMIRLKSLRRGRRGLSDLSIFFGPRLALDGFLLNCSPSLSRLLAFFQAVAVSAGRVPLTGRSARPGALLPIAL